MTLYDLYLATTGGGAVVYVNNVPGREATMWYPAPLRCTLTTGVDDGKDARAPTHVE